MIFRIVDLVKAVNANVFSEFGNFQILARLCEDETEVWIKVVKGPIDLMYSMHWSVGLVIDASRGVKLYKQRCIFKGDRMEWEIVFFQTNEI